MPGNRNQPIKGKVGGEISLQRWGTLVLAPPDITLDDVFNFDFGRAVRRDLSVVHVLPLRVRKELVIPAAVQPNY